MDNNQLQKLTGSLLAMEYFLIMKVRRGETFVTKKITMGLARINAGLEKCLYLGIWNLKRLGSYKRLYCNAMALLQQEIQMTI